MKIHQSFLAAACGMALLVTLAPARAAQSQQAQQAQQSQAQPSPSANFVGTWFVSMEGGGRGAGRRGAPPANNNGSGNGGDNGSANAPSGNNGTSDNGSGDNGNNAPPANGGGQVRQAFVITADGSNFQVSHRTRQGETVSQATASGNTLSWTEQRTGREGRTVEAKFTATVTGDTMQGTVAGPRGRVQREFTGTREQGQ